MRQILGRLLWTVLVLWFVLSASFAIAYAIPADPARAMVGPHADAATVARVASTMCLDRSLAVRYYCHVARIARGDLGVSFRTRRPVSDLIAERIWPTAQLALSAVLLQLVFGAGLGMLAASRRGSVVDSLVEIVSVAGQSAPTFFLGPLLMYLVGYRLGWLPVSGYGDPGIERMSHLILPALTLAIPGTAATARLARSEFLHVLAEDYIRTARAKGLSEWRVVLKHALPNAIGPIVTLAGVDLGVLMGGAVVTESVFVWPGLGREVVLAVMNMDLPVILGVVLVSALAISLTNLAVDAVACLARGRSMASPMTTRR
ncbi:MAG: ABC transporter permease [Pseudomonadota bacterium]